MSKSLELHRRPPQARPLFCQLFALLLIGSNLLVPILHGLAHTHSPEFIASGPTARASHSHSHSHSHAHAHVRDGAYHHSRSPSHACSAATSRAKLASRDPANAPDHDHRTCLVCQALAGSWTWERPAPSALLCSASGITAPTRHSSVSLHRRLDLSARASRAPPLWG